MLRAKFSTIKIRAYLLQQCDTNFGHFNNKFCHKVNKTSYEFSQEIADCCSIRLATLLQKNCKYLFKFDLNFSLQIKKPVFTLFFGILIKIRPYMLIRVYSLLHFYLGPYRVEEKYASAPKSKIFLRAF